MNSAKTLALLASALVIGASSAALAGTDINKVTHKDTATAQTAAPADPCANEKTDKEKTACLNRMQGKHAKYHVKKSKAKAKAKAKAAGTSAAAPK